MRVVPKRIKVGHNQKKGLSFVTYNDYTGKWRQEDSFYNWIESTSDIEYYENRIVDSLRFVGWSGGVENSWGYDTRKTYVQIEDKRGFIFEVTVSNFLDTLKYALKRNPRDGELILDYQLGWDGTQVCIAPVKDESWDVPRGDYENDRMPITKLSQLEVDKCYRVGDSNIILVFLGRFKPITYHLRHRYPKVNKVWYPRGRQETLNALKSIQSSIYPAQKFPEMEEIINDGNADKQSLYFFTTENRFYYPDGVREYKGVPANLYELSEGLPAEYTDALKIAKKSIQYLMYPIKKVTYEKYSLSDFLNISYPSSFLAKNFNGAIVNVEEKDLLEIPVSYETNKDLIIRYPVLFNFSTDLETAYEVFDPYRVKFILDDGSEEGLEVAETDYALRTILPIYK